MISGGFKSQADRAQKLLGITHAFSAVEYFWNLDGTISHHNIMPCDYQGKVDFMKLIMHDYNLSPEECGFVGDGANDIAMTQAVGTSISFNGSPKLEKAATHSIRQNKGKEDFRSILSHLNI